MGSIAFIASYIASKLRPSPVSFPIDQKTTDGWFLSRSTIATPRATKAPVHAGSSAM